MAIQVVFPTNTVSVTLDPLYQWDKGHTLSIVISEVPTRAEVHFTYPEIDDVLARPCTISGGIASVQIPDECFEQPKNITAWFYEMGTANGKTTRVITIPIIPRTRPPKTVLEV